jgi:hypothetical protein
MGCTVSTRYFVRYGPVDDRNFDHRTHRCFLSLGYARGNFVGLAVPVTCLPLAVTHDNESGKTEATTSFDNGRATLDFENAVNVRVTLGSFDVCVCHAFVRSQLKLESGFTSSFGKGCYSPMVFVWSSIEAHLFDPRLDCAFSQDLAQGSGGGTVPTVTHLALEPFFR